MSTDAAPELHATRPTRNLRPPDAAGFERAARAHQVADTAERVEHRNSALQVLAPLWRRDRQVAAELEVGAAELVSGSQCAGDHDCPLPAAPRPARATGAVVQQTAPQQRVRAAERK